MSDLKSNANVNAEELDAFKKDFIEHLNNFFEKCKEYENEDVDLYEWKKSNLDLYDLDFYGSSEYDYPTLLKAKRACKDAIQEMCDDAENEYEKEAEEIESSAEEYYEGLKDLFGEFLSGLSDAYDDCVELDCTDETEEYVNQKKGEILDYSDPIEQMTPPEPERDLFSVNEYFDMCTYDEDEDEEEYCFDMSDAYDSMRTDIADFLDTAEDDYPSDVEDTYLSVIEEFCNQLKAKLNLL